MAEAWLAESVRLSALWLGPQSSGDLPWELVTGRPPDLQETQPRLGTRREAGPLGDGSINLEYRVSPGRVDWVLVPVFSVDTQSKTFPNVGSVGEAVDVLRTLLFAKAAEAYSAPRFAFGLVATRQTGSTAESYRDLQSLLKNLNLNFDGASDFMYQINRPRPSAAVPGTMINRLSRWMSATMSGIRVVIPSQGSVDRTNDTPVFATRVEFDISTAADRTTPFPLESRAALFEEFVNLAFEQLVTGDVP